MVRKILEKERRMIPCAYCDKWHSPREDTAGHCFTLQIWYCKSEDCLTKYETQYREKLRMEKITAEIPRVKRKK